MTALPLRGCDTLPMLHGERKTPGGKLAVVDLEVADGRLANVTVSGDFFLEPPETLEALRTALEGAPADAGVAELTRRLAAAVPDGAELIGVSPEAVAIATRRALDAADGAA